MINYIYNHKYYRNVVILLGVCLTGGQSDGVSGRNESNYFMY